MNIKEKVECSHTFNNSKGPPSTEEQFETFMSP